MELTCSNRLSIIRLHPGVSGTIFARGHLYPRLLYSFTRCSSVMEVTVSGERRVASMRFLIILNSLLISYESRACVSYWLRFRVFGFWFGSGEWGGCLPLSTAFDLGAWCPRVRPWSVAGGGFIALEVF